MKFESTELRISTAPADVERVRENIRNIVWNSAEAVVAKLIESAMTGQVAAAKYLFEMVGMNPAMEELGREPAEESFALTLLKRLGLPTEPVTCDEDLAAQYRGEDSDSQEPA
jgi:hypothetical protein